jgi:hypothetical protein
LCAQGVGGALGVGGVVVWMLVVVAAGLLQRPCKAAVITTAHPPAAAAAAAAVAAAAARRYITIANMPDQAALPAYAIRASCVNTNPLSTKLPGAAAAAAAAATNSSSSSQALLKEGGVPCPVPSPGGKQCNGHGKCRIDTTVSQFRQLVK